MRSIFDIHDFDDNFLEQFTSQTIPIYDLWSVRPLQNDQKEIIAGNSNDADKFSNFITDHSNQDFPHPLVIVVGNAEKTNSERMTNTSKHYFKIKFEKFKGNDLGEPLTVAGASPQAYQTDDTPPMAFNGMNINKAKQNNPMQGFSLGDIHGIIDRNVADATRTIKAEYEEQSARREAESIKRLAEIETRMEMYKLDLREKEVNNREQELKKEQEELEYKKIEGMGSVKDYTKTIAGGLLEFGKVALGLDGITYNSKNNSSTDSKNKAETKKIDLGTSNLDDDGFTEIKNDELKINNENNNLEIVLNGIANLDEEQKMALLEALIPDSHGESDIMENSKQVSDENKQKPENSEENIKK